MKWVENILLWLFADSQQSAGKWKFCH